MKQNMISFRNPEIDLEFDFSINDYQFPDTTCGPDANWLIVAVECRYQGKVFVKTDPSLDAQELEEIFNWFQSISRNTIPKYTYLSFTEPNLEFQLYHSKSGRIRFGIKLDAECKPPFHVSESTIEPVEPHDDFVMMFENSFDEISDYSARYRKLIASFPRRSET